MPSDQLIWTRNAPPRTATLNTRTLVTPGKTGLLVDQFTKYKLALCGLSETHWPGSDEREVQGSAGARWHFLCSGTTGRRQQGVAVPCSPSTRKACTSCTPISSRLIKATFRTTTTPLTVIQAYAPTNANTTTQSPLFYSQLQDAINSTPPSHQLLLLGDFNAKVGQQAEQWAGCIGRFGQPGSPCNNGNLLLTLCASNGLLVADTVFQHKDIHLRTWRSPDNRTSIKLSMCWSESVMLAS